MKPIRQFFAVPFYAAAFVVVFISIAVDLFGCAVTFFGALVEGAK